MTDNVVVAFAGGVVSKEQQSAFNIFADEIIYQSQLTNSDLITKLKELKINKYPIYADAAEPGRIEEIRRAGCRRHQPLHLRYGG